MCVYWLQETCCFLCRLKFNSGQWGSEYKIHVSRKETVHDLTLILSALQWVQTEIKCHHRSKHGNLNTISQKWNFNEFTMNSFGDFSQDVLWNIFPLISKDGSSFCEMLLFEVKPTVQRSHIYLISTNVWHLAYFGCRQFRLSFSFSVQYPSIGDMEDGETGGAYYYTEE